MLELKDKNVHPLVDAAIIVLIIVDTFLLILITFYDLNPTTVSYIIYFDLAVCFVLFVEFVYRIRKETNKKGYAIKHWYDIIAMIPLDLIAFNIPFLRAFRFVRFLRYARILRVFALARKSIRHFGEFIKDTHLHLSLGILIFTIFSGTIIFFILEGSVNTKVLSLWDSFWYVMPTVATIGSEDIIPQTPAGKVVSMFMMLIGLIFFGMLTASIAYWYIERMEKKIQKESESEIEELKSLIIDLQSEVSEMKELIDDKKK